MSSRARLQTGHFIPNFITQRSTGVLTITCAIVAMPPELSEDFVFPIRAIPLVVSDSKAIGVVSGAGEHHHPRARPRTNSHRTGPASPAQVASRSLRLAGDGNHNPSFFGCTCTWLQCDVLVTRICTGTYSVRLYALQFHRLVRLDVWSHSVGTVAAGTLWQCTTVREIEARPCVFVFHRVLEASRSQDEPSILCSGNVQFSF